MEGGAFHASYDSVRKPPMPAFDLDIGVIYTHERQLMPRLLETMSASGRQLRMRLILVDNASADALEPWCAYFPQTRILSNGRRLSYAANLNRILDASTARYTSPMNTDMYSTRACTVWRGWWLSWTAGHIAGWRAAGCIMPMARTRTPPGDFPRCRWCWRGDAAWAGYCVRRSGTISTPSTPPRKPGPATGFPVVF